MSITILGDESIRSVALTIAALADSDLSVSFEVTASQEDSRGGRLLVALSYPELIRVDVVEKYDHALVLHGSDLPEGRGWSPVQWQLLEGRVLFTMSLIRIATPVDSGNVVLKRSFKIPKSALYEEISAIIAATQAAMIVESLGMTDSDLLGYPQQGTPTYLRRRTRADSELDPTKSIASQWDKIRIADGSRFPTFFELEGRKYTLKLEEIRVK